MAWKNFVRKAASVAADTATLGGYSAVKDGNYAPLLGAAAIGPMGATVASALTPSGQTQSTGDLLPPPVAADAAADNEDVALANAKERARLLAGGRQGTMAAGTMFGYTKASGKKLLGS